MTTKTSQASSTAVATQNTRRAKSFKTCWATRVRGINTSSQLLTRELMVYLTSQPISANSES